MATDTARIDPTESSTGWTVWGHDHAVGELQAAIRLGVRHAYILSGFHKLGKRTLAMEFARALVCLRPPSPGVPCRDCRACRRVGRGTHPDVTIYDLESQQETAEKASTSKNLSLNIQTVRAITSSIALRPMEASHRVMIVDDVETMQETAQEAFLKTLEEPPAYAVILLLTSDAELLLPTIRSRCATIQLQSVLTPAIADALVAAGVPEDRAETISAASVGRPGWAFEAANDPDMLSSRLALRSSVLAWIQGNQYERMAEATRLGDAFSKDRNAVYARLSAVQTVWRSAVLQSLGVGDLEVGETVGAAIGGIAPGEALVALRSVEDCLNDLDSNVRPRLALQSMVLQWPTLTR